MSLQRKVYKVMVATWEALVTWYYLLVIVACAVAVLFLAAFVIAMAVDLANKVTM